MKIKTLFSLVLLQAFLTTTVNAEDNLKMNNEQMAVLNAVKSMTASFHEGDLDGVMSSYEKDAVIVFEPGKGVSDAEVIKEAFKGWFAVNPHFEYAGHDVVISGDIAVHFAPWKMNGTTPDGQKIEQSGLSVAVLRRQEDGNWLMVIDNPYGAALLEQ